MPTAVVCTDAYIDTADAMASFRGHPGYKYVAVPHPVAELSEAELVQISGSFVDEVVEVLS